MIDGINAVLERQREYHPSFVLMGGGFERSLQPWGRPIPNGERVAELDGGEELSLSECFRRSWEEEKHLFITGPGGVGKTVALLTFATEEGFLPRRTAAVYIPLYDLSQYADERRDCVDEYLSHTFSRRQLEAIDILSRQDWIDGPGLILLMDGYNEIPPERRRHVEAGMRKWAIDRPGTQIVTTSRVPGLVRFAHMMRLSLRSLTEDDVVSYLRTRHPDVAIPESGSPLAQLLKTPLMLRLYAGVGEYRRRVDNERIQFRNSQTAGDLVWNYLQAELHACKSHMGGHSERTYAETLLLTLPYVCWRMEAAHRFEVDRKEFKEYVDAAVRCWECREWPEYVVEVGGGPSPNDVGDAHAHLSILEGVSGLIAKGTGGDYSLVHQGLRDSLAAIHLLSVVTATHECLPTEFKSFISEYVKNYCTELLSKDQILTLWEVNRGTLPTDIIATNNLLRIVHKLLNGNLTMLSWSGMDLRGTSLFPYRRGLRLELSREPVRFEGTRMDVGCFTPQGHARQFTAVCFSPDGRLIASGSWDRTVRLWDAATGCHVGRPLEGHGGSVRSVCFSPDGRLLVSGSSDGTVRLWDAASGLQLESALNIARPVDFVTFTARGLHICYVVDNVLNITTIKPSVFRHYALLRMTNMICGITVEDFFIHLCVDMCVIMWLIWVFRYVCMVMLERGSVEQLIGELPFLLLALAIGFSVEIRVRRVLTRFHENPTEYRVGFLGLSHIDRLVYHIEGKHLIWSNALVIPLHGIDITGLDFTKAKLDRKTRKILRKNGAKA